MAGLAVYEAEKPLRLELFNEARSRLGYVIADVELENIQIFLLSAITESALHLELDLPLTSVHPIKDSVDLPTFISPFCEAGHRSNEATHFKKHYKAQLALHHLCVYLDSGINDCMPPFSYKNSELGLVKFLEEHKNIDQVFPAMSTTMDTPGTSEDIHDTTASYLKQLNLQLDQWLSMLPPELKWPEDDPTVFPESTRVQRSFYASLDPSLITNLEVLPGTHLFTADINQEPERYPYVYDIQVAFLRTRFYYVRYIVNRHFVYKALHFLDQVTPADIQGIENCLKACLKWPITLSPVSRQKRLVPYLFCWTQAFFGILLILHLSQHVPSLRKVRESLGGNFEADAADSIKLMLDWIRDLKHNDPFADLCYHVLGDFYSTELLL